MIAKRSTNPGFDWTAATHSSRSTVVAVQQATQTGCRNYVLCQISVLPLSTPRFLERHIALSLMWPFRVVPGTVFGTDVPQMILAKADEMIQGFLLNALHETFRIRVHVRLHRTNPFHFYAFSLQNRFKVSGVLGVIITDQGFRLNFSLSQCMSTFLACCFIQARCPVAF